MFHSHGACIDWLKNMRAQSLLLCVCDVGRQLSQAFDALLFLIVRPPLKHKDSVVPSLQTVAALVNLCCHVSRVILVHHSRIMFLEICLFERGVPERACSYPENRLIVALQKM
jgi:hypothetical protein